MNIAKLQTFLTLADCLSFTEASDKLYCSQPAVSMQVQSLENDLGVPLFDRIGKKLYLTKHGELFKPYAENIVNLLEAAREHLQQLENLSTGTLSFGASNFVGTYLIPDILGQFQKKYPGIRVNMNITFSQQLIRLLETNKLEFLLLSDEIDVDPSRYLSQTICKDELVLVAAPEHPLAKREVCSLHDLVNETILFKPQKSATRIFLEKKFKEIGVSFPKFMEINNSEAIKQGVIHGVGFSMLSKFSVQQEIEWGLLCKINLHDITFDRGINYIYGKNKHMSPAAKKFLAMLLHRTSMNQPS